MGAELIILFYYYAAAESGSSDDVKILHAIRRRHRSK